MITVETMSESLRHVFVKECDVPMHMLEDPYFLYLIDLMDEYTGEVKAKLKRFLHCVNQCDGEAGFNEVSARLRSGVALYIGSKPEYDQFITADMSPYAIGKDKVELYHYNNDGKRFVSVDLVKANFQALRFFDPKLVDEKETYEDFISQFAIYDHFIKSRQVRQYIFGNLNPNRQMTIARYLIAQISKAIKKIYPEIVLSSFSHDEIVFEHLSVPGFVEEIKNISEATLGVGKVKVENYIIRRIGDRAFYMKQYDDGSFKLKNVPEYFIPQVYKYVKHLPVNEMDLYFRFEGQSAKFNKPLFQGA